MRSGPPGIFCAALSASSAACHSCSHCSSCFSVMRHDDRILNVRHRKAPDDAGAFVVSSVPGDDGAFAHAEQIVEADLEDMLLRALGDSKIRETRGAGEARGERNVRGTVVQIVILELRSYIVGEGIFNAEANKQTVHHTAAGCKVGGDAAETV